MTPTPRHKAPTVDPGPLRVADSKSDPFDGWALNKKRDQAKPILPCPKDVEETHHAPPLAATVKQSTTGRRLAAGIEPMLSIDDLAALLNCSRRLVERMRSAGKVPKPDLHVGKMPRWRAATIRAWVEGGGL